jgi:hypothetical protein
VDNPVDNFFMTEKKLRLKLKELLGKYGALWFPPQVKYYNNDILGAFDCVFFNGFDVYFIQITTLTNISHRRRKINFIFNNHPPHNSQIYAWDDKNNCFKIENFSEQASYGAKDVDS